MWFINTQRNNPVRSRRACVCVNACKPGDSESHTHPPITRLPWYHPVKLSTHERLFSWMLRVLWSHARETGCTICAVRSLACNEISGVKMTRLVHLQGTFLGSRKTYLCLFSINPVQQIRLIYLNEK